MNKRGQALVEFIIILPIFLILVLGVIDIGKILYNKTMLEGIITDVISMYESGHTLTEIETEMDLESSDLSIEENEDFIEVSLTKEIDIITPGLNLIFDNPYQLDVRRSIAHE